MATKKDYLKNHGGRNSRYRSAVLFEKLEERVLLSSDPLLISAEALVDNLEPAVVVSSEVSLDITPAEALAQWQVLFPDNYYVIWAKDSPWDALDQVTAPPAGVTELTNISLDIGRNEYESTSFVITNVFDSALPIDLSYVSTDLSLTLRKGVWITAQDGTRVNDALSLIDGDQVTLAPGESIEIWVTINGNDAAAGLYTPTIDTALPYIDPVTIDLSVTVHDVSLPDVLPLNTAYWDYVTPGGNAIINAEKLADLKSHHVNTVNVHPFYVPRFEFDGAGQLVTSYALFDAAIDLYEVDLQPETYVFEMLSLIYFEPSDVPGYPGSMHRPTFLSTEWRTGFQQWLTGWVAHMQSRGIGYEDYFVHPYDERLDANVYEVAKLIKETDPNIRIVTNAIGSASEVNNIAPYVDVWMPLMAHWLPIGGVTGGMGQTISEIGRAHV